MFDVFLCICQEYYVGDKATNSEKKNSPGSLLNITKIKMKRRHGQRGIDSPDEVYTKYTSFAAELS